MTHSAEQMRKKEEARKESLDHMERNVVGDRVSDARKDVNQVGEQVNDKMRGE